MHLRQRLARLERQYPQSKDGGAFSMWLALLSDADLTTLEDFARQMHDHPTAAAEKAIRAWCHDHGFDLGE